MAEASGLRLIVDADAALWFAPGEAICKALGADPWGVLASGALLAAFPEDIAHEAEAALRGEGRPTARLCRAEKGVGVTTLSGGALRRYEQDEVARVLSKARP